MQNCTKTTNLTNARNPMRAALRVTPLAAALVLAAGTNAQCLPADVYSAPLTAASGSLPLGVATGDLNNDGNIDVVTANFFGGSASILFGNGDGTLQAAIDIDMVDPMEIETAAPVQAGIADLNGDGWNDIALGVQSPDLGDPGLAVLLNDGAGNFSGPPAFYGFAVQLRGFEIIDMDGDGNLDVIYSDRDDQSIITVPGNGDGTFENADFTFTTGGPTGVALADYDGNGTTDVAVSMVFSSEVAVFSNNGSGNLTEIARFSADSPEGIEVGDINGDGNADLLTPFLNGDAVQFFLGNGDGTFGAKQVIATGASSLPFSVAFADANHDGFDDIHVGLFLAGAAQVHLSNGDGTFQAPEVFPVGARPRDFAKGDFNGDGNDDLVAANGDSAGTATVILNTCVTAQPCVADTNGDGNLTPADFNAWILAFNSSAPECDQNGDNVCTPADFNAWILNFNAGC